MPATVGMMRNFDLLEANALMLGLSLVVSTALAMAVDGADLPPDDARLT